MMEENNNVTQEQFVVYVSSQQAQLKELTTHVKINNFLTTGVIVILLTLIFFQGFQRIKI